MGKINVLGFEIANLIAAGEVVDRPASVVKELLENAIDAGATEIVCEIRAGGVSMIRVSDNGCGMSPEDLPVAIRRHATSKIHSADDLTSISTLGFRGEALAAIAAVSELKIISKTKDAATGTLLSASGGNITEITDVGCADGTTVLVENLFASVPARRKFLKRDATEAAAVSAMVEKVAMSRPDIAVTLTIDGADKFSTPGDGNLQNALYALLGRDFATRLLAVKGESGGIAVSGFVGRSDNARGNRNAQNVFINARYVRSKTVTAALERAFNSYMAPEKFPVAVLFLTCDPRVVDVNVHPAKLEVRFSNEQAVFEAVYYAVRAALEAGQGRPELSLENTRRTTYLVDKDPADAGADRYRVPTPQTGKTPSFGASYTGGDTRPPVSIPPRAGNAGAYVARPVSSAQSTPEESNRFLSDLAKARENTASGVRVANPGIGNVPETPPTVGGLASDVPAYRYIGDAFRTYLFLETDGELLIIDQHAAHERLLFEELKANLLRDGRVASQSMLLPLPVPLDPEGVAAAVEYREDLLSIGFAFAESKSGVEISSIPSDVAIPDAEDLFKKSVASLEEGRGDPTVTARERRERALYQVACKAAIKGGRLYAKEQLEYLARRVMEDPSVTVCPHGRPIAVRLTKEELDRRFDRIK